MSELTNCRDFQELLDRLAEGTLPEGGLRRLRTHAASCPDCAALLQLHEHLAHSSLAELEATVPKEMAGDMLQRLEGELASRVARRTRLHASWPQRWLVPALASAVALLILGSGLLLGELRQLREREHDLNRRLQQQERLLDGLSRPAFALAALPDARRGARPLWERSLLCQETVSTGELQVLLARLPADARLLDARDVENVAAAMPRHVAGAWPRALSDIETSDGLQAGELLGLFESLDLDPDERIPTERLLSLLRARRGNL